MGSTGVDVDEGAEDNGLEEREGDDAVADKSSDDLICGGEVFLY